MDNDQAGLKQVATIAPASRKGSAGAEVIQRHYAPMGHTHDVTIYTDGSSSMARRGRKASGGWAFVAAWASRVTGAKGTAARYGFHYGKGAEIGAMELTAIVRALNFVRRGAYCIHIISDSEYAIKAITEWSHVWAANGWKTGSGSEARNKELLIAARKAITEHRSAGAEVVFSHVRGHSGVAGNEHADSLAGQARRKGRTNWTKLCSKQLSKQTRTR